MSQLRLGRLPDGTRDIRILEPATGRLTFARYGLRPSVTGAYVVARKPHSRAATYPTRVSNYVDDGVRKNPDNGGVKPAITEVQR